MTKDDPLIGRCYRTLHGVAQLIDIEYDNDNQPYTYHVLMVDDKVEITTYSYFAMYFYFLNWTRLI